MNHNSGALSFLGLIYVSAANFRLNDSSKMVMELINILLSGIIAAMLKCHA